MPRTVLISLTLLLITSIPATAQKNAVLRKATYKAYTISKIELWDKSINHAEKIYSESGSYDALHDLVMVQYGYIAFCIAEDLNKKGKLMLKSAYSNLEEMHKQCGETTDYMAIDASFVAFELNFYPLKMMSLASKAVELTDKAYALDHNNFMALACKANQLNFTPKMFGGSPEEAIPLYKKIISLYETHCEEPESNWRYVSTLVTLAETYENLKMYNKACSLYEKIIDFDDNINWINNKLYPACKKKLSAQQSGN